jgi:plasmid stability protein
MTKTITLKNIPVELYELLEQNASRNHRSIHNEIIEIIENSLQSQTMTPDDFFAYAQRLRQKTKGRKLTEDLLYQAKNEGRP